MSIFFILIIILWLYLSYFILSMVVDKNKIDIKNLSIWEHDEYISKKREEERIYKKLREKYDLEELIIKSKDNVNIDAIYIKNNSNKWVILSPGYLENSKSMMPIASYYTLKNYNVLAINNKRRYITFGYNESNDIVSFILYIQKHYPNSKIVLHGISVGAFSSLLINKYKINPNIKGIIADSSYTSAYDIFEYQLHLRLGILTLPMMFCINLIYRLKFKKSLKELNALELMKNSKYPCLFIHAKDDDFISPYMTKELHKVCTSEKEVYYLEGNYEEAFIKDNQKYKKILDDFLEKYMRR